jgi:hypothetical protein
LVAVLSPHHPHWVHVQPQSSSAAVLARLGIEDVRLPKAEIETLESLGVLVQQEAEVRCRFVRGRDGKQHDRPDELLANQNERRVWAVTVRYQYNYSLNESIAAINEAVGNTAQN